MDAATTPRRREGPRRLLRRATGGRREIAGKVARIGRTPRLWLDRYALDRRMQALEEAQMVAGRHPCFATIAATVEEPDDHERLLDSVRRYRRDPATPRLRRRGQTLHADAVFAAAARTFATLPGFLAYCCKLPRRPWALPLRLVAVRSFPAELAVEDAG